MVRVQAVDRLGGAAKLRLGNRAAPAGFGIAFAVKLSVNPSASL
jgi:hypothetical protein